MNRPNNVNNFIFSISVVMELNNNKTIPTEVNNDCELDSHVNTEVESEMDSDIDYEVDSDTDSEIYYKGNSSEVDSDSDSALDKTNIHSLEHSNTSDVVYEILQEFQVRVIQSGKGI